MKVIVFSDSHGCYAGLEKVYLAQRDAGLFLFLGDGLADAQRLKRAYPEIPLRCVRGNCDGGDKSAPNEDTVEVEGRLIYFTHGHLYGVKYDDAQIVQRGKELGAAAVFYGHTHFADCRQVGQMWLCNPGSIVWSQRGRYSFIIAEADRGGLYCVNTSIAAPDDRPRWF